MQRIKGKVWVIYWDKVYRQTYQVGPEFKNIVKRNLAVLKYGVRFAYPSSMALFAF
jgi:hypothetical protein